ncbi:MAG: hypothetical protein LH619_13490 [Chitinophagaceae bacterium]|nr:hypothetical protein [Chitinophagaceae bacterium]
MKKINGIAIFLLVIISFTLYSCFMSRTKIIIPLPGKIAVNVEDSLFIFDNSNIYTSNFKIRDDEHIEYSGFQWINKNDIFIGVEYIKNDTTGITQGNVVCFNLNGNIVRRLYESQKGEIAGYSILSRNDKHLLFTVQKKGDINQNLLAGLNGEQSIVILDFENGEVIKKVENIGTSLTLGLNESPWLYDQNQFIYTISGEKNITLEGSKINSIKEVKLGVYLYDILSDQKTLLIPDAHLGISCPTDHYIAYLKNQSIYVMSLKDHTAKEIYKVKSEDRVTNIHWTPDGNHIYIAYYSSGLTEEILIDLSTGKEIPFYKIGHGFNPYTWK